MTTVSTTRAAQLESWMVPRLFGSSTSDQTAVAVKDPFSASMSSTGVSGATSEAIGRLKQGGPPERQSVALSNAIVKRLNGMTSDEITKAMYSGQGLASAGGLADSPNTTFSSIMKEYTDSAVTYRRFAADASYSADQRQNSAEIAGHMDDLAATLQKAFDNKTLVFHKASEIEGLDFRENITFSDDLRAPFKGADEYNINSTFLTENHLEDHVLSVPGITLFMSW